MMGMGVLVEVTGLMIRSLGFNPVLSSRSFDGYPSTAAEANMLRTECPQGRSTAERICWDVRL